MHRAREPFRCHLFGVVKGQPLLPLLLPYNTSSDRPKPLFSEMSFKCRSSTTLSSTLVASLSESRTSLRPKQPEKMVGLGIFAPRSSMPSLLGPWPSLSSIRSHASIRLPPLPPYLPERYKKGSALHRAIHPPQPPQRTSRRPSERTVRVVLPSPALSAANLSAFNKSAESLSSVYSRSISGEQHGPRTQRRPTALAGDDGSFSSSSTATVKKSSLGMMRLAADPDVFIDTQQQGGRLSSGTVSDSDSDLDHVATLQARLPSVKPVSEFGDVSSWTEGQAAANYSRNSYEICMGGKRKLEFAPLNVRRTRDSAPMFS